MSGCSMASVRGSSPHARGTEHRAIVPEEAHGIIPACAGNSRTTPPTSASSRDHPRMRGEQNLGEIGVCVIGGSSPHARGTVGHEAVDDGIVGIIPACAGNRWGFQSRPSASWDHPRMRGEQTTGDKSWICTSGSSPHARGTVGNEWHALRVVGIIPACAGNRRRRSRARSLGWDHPRMRGEQPLRKMRRGVRMGSSPHARGTASTTPRTRAGAGIIPACAGNSPTPSARPPAARDHPRMRGEQRSRSSCERVRMGSSPHARGTGCWEPPDVALPGIIPACAGNSTAKSSRRSTFGDHPRMRGEQPRRSRTTPPRPGSSPHARGTEQIENVFLSLVGIIPACAGNRLDDQRRLLTQSDFTFTFQEEETQPAALSCLASAKFARFSELAS